jgi:hypothetical protein
LEERDLSGLDDVLAQFPEFRLQALAFCRDLGDFADALLPTLGLLSSQKLERIATLSLEARRLRLDLSGDPSATSLQFGQRQRAETIEFGSQLSHFVSETNNPQCPMPWLASGLRRTGPRMGRRPPTRHPVVACSPSAVACSPSSSSFPEHDAIPASAQGHFTTRAF